MVGGLAFSWMDAFSGGGSAACDGHDLLAMRHSALNSERRCSDGTIVCKATRVPEMRGGSSVPWEETGGDDDDEDVVAVVGRSEVLVCCSCDGASE